jgi:5'-nucleotidase
LRRRGVEAIVVLAHAGAFQTGRRAAGEVVDEAREMSDAVDVVVSGHTHSYLNTRVGRKLVVQSYSYGNAFDRVEMTIDRRSGDVVASRAEVPRTLHAGIRPDAAVAAVVKRYARLVKPLAGRVLTNSRRSFSRERGDLGHVVAAAQRRLADTDMAFVNPGNMREDLRSGPVTYAEVCAIEAYGHPVMRMRMRGRWLKQLLREQWRGPNTRLYSSGLPRRIDPERVYTVAANELIATGDRFSALRDHGIGKRPVGTDVQALVSYLEHRPGALG